MSYAVVTEAGDGTVYLSGPYDEETAALKDAARIAAVRADGLDQLLTVPNADAFDAAWVIGEDGEDESYVYVRWMAPPEKAS